MGCCPKVFAWSRNGKPGSASAFSARWRICSRLGYGAVCLIDSDSPTLPAAALAAAVSARAARRPHRARPERGRRLLSDRRQAGAPPVVRGHRLEHRTRRRPDPPARGGDRPGNGPIADVVRRGRRPDACAPCATNFRPCLAPRAGGRFPAPKTREFLPACSSARAARVSGRRRRHDTLLIYKCAAPCTSVILSGASPRAQSKDPRAGTSIPCRGKPRIWPWGV